MGDVIRRALGFLMIPLYTRYLSPADYGIIELVELFVTIAGICFGLAVVGDSMVRIYHEYFEDRDRGTVVSSAIFIVALLSAGVALIVMFLADPISALVFGSAKYAWLLRSAFVALTFSSVTEIALLYQQVKQRAVFFVIFYVAQLLAGAGLNIYFIAIAREGVWGFVLSKLIVAGVSAVVLLWVVLRETGVGFHRECARRMVSFGGPLMFASVSMFIIHFSDRFFLNHFNSLADVGVYALAYKIGFLVTYLVGQPFGNVWNVSLFAHVDENRWQERFARVFRCLAFFLLFVATGISVFANGMLTIAVSREYLAAVALVPVIALGYAFREAGDFFRGLLFINKRVFLFGRITMSCAALNLALDWVLIRQYGTTGAAWATLLTWLAYMVACWLLALREHRLPISPADLVVLSGIGTAVYWSSTLLRPGRLPVQFAGDIVLMLLFLAYGWKAGYLNFLTDSATPVEAVKSAAAATVPE
jgi:O-antigen/teichoic acid export membrane protein